MNIKERIDYLDKLKGLAIFLVVLGHIFSASELSIDLFNFIYSFHMPLFMFLAGSISVVSYNPYIGAEFKYTEKRFVNLIIPYLTWSLAAPLFFCKNIFAIDWEKRFTATFLENNTYWFLPTLFGLTIMFMFLKRIHEYLYDKVLKEEAQRSEVLLFFIEGSVLCVIIAALLLLVVFTDNPFVKNILTYSLPFFFGVLCYEYSFLMKLIDNKWTYTISLVMYMSLIGIFSFNNIAIETNILRNVLGFFAIIVILNVFTKYKIHPWLGNHLTLFGRHTLIIYVVHGRFVNFTEIFEFFNSSNICLLLIIFGISSVVICYLCILLAKVLELSPVTKFLCLGRL